MVSALEPHAIGARFDPLACPSLMVPSGGETDVKLGFLALGFGAFSMDSNREPMKCGIKR
jgi:hypothetical protein